MKFKTLETERLILRQLTPEVYDYIFTNYTDKECKTHLGVETNEALEAEKAKYKKGLSAYDRTFIIFQLIEKSSNKVMGITGFVRYYPDHFRAELGYSLFKDEYKRMGFMTEATAPMIAFGFETMNLQRIEAIAGPDNEASIKILEHLGFEKEGLMRRHYFRNGIGEDSAIYALLRE